MNVRKPTDYSAMYGMLDQLMGAEFPQMELYFEIGKIVCAHPEKGTAVMAAEYLQANYPGDRGFSPRNLRRMREFYRAYADNSELRALALKLGWTQNMAILEGCESFDERTWYLRAALGHHWTKVELLEQIQAGAWLREELDEPDNTCYTESNIVSVGCLEHEEDPFCVSWQYLSEPDGRVCDESPRRLPAGRRSATRSTRLPGGSWRNTVSPAAAMPPGSSATATTRNTTCSLGWTGQTSAACTASAAATSTTRCTC